MAKLASFVQLFPSSFEFHTLNPSTLQFPMFYSFLCSKLFWKASSSSGIGNCSPILANLVIDFFGTIFHFLFLNKVLKEI